MISNSSNNNNRLNSDSITARELMDRLDNRETLNLLDVREVIEFHTRNIGGVNVPLHRLMTDPRQLSWPHEAEIIVICSAGLRSQTAQSILQQNGYHNVRNLTGGLLAIEKLQSI